jgi:hypothetical protein
MIMSIVMVFIMMFFMMATAFTYVAVNVATLQ